MFSRPPGEEIIISIRPEMAEFVVLAMVPLPMLTICYSHVIAFKCGYSKTIQVECAARDVLQVPKHS